MKKSYKVYPNYIKVYPTSEYYNELVELLTKRHQKAVRDYYDTRTRSWKFRKDWVSEPLYKVGEGSSLEISQGFTRLLPAKYQELFKLDTLNLSYPEIDMDLDRVRKVLNSFDLRPDQISAVMKALLFKRGTIQAGTGCGKSAMMAAICKLLVEENPDIKILVLEPTLVLVGDMLKFFNENDIKSIDYKTYLTSDDKSYNVLITHPKSILTNLESNILGKIQAVMWDECQHVGCDTYTTVNSYLDYAEVSIGFSALVVQEDHIYSPLSELTYEEALVLGCSGPIIFHAPPSYYIESGILSTPYVFQIQYEIPSYLKQQFDYTKLSAGVRKDQVRQLIINESISQFVELGRRVLVLVPTKQLAYDLSSQLLANYGYTSILSFGSNQGYIVDPIRQVKFMKNAPTEFNDNDDYQIMIATSHLDEGVDLKKLDVVILAAGGKSSRRLVQRIGRILRLSKSGKYAYVVDFTDEGNPILVKHRNERLRIYKDELGMDESQIYSNVLPQQIGGIVQQLEGLGNL